MDLPSITEVEMNARITLKFDVMAGRNLPEPELRTTAAPGHAASGPHYATTTHGPDLHECARQAVLHMINHVVRGSSREEAYIPRSVAVDLKVSEIVDAPNWIISAFLPEMIFGGAGS